MERGQATLDRGVEPILEAEEEEEGELADGKKEKAGRQSSEGGEGSTLV